MTPSQMVGPIKKVSRIASCEPAGALFPVGVAAPILNNPPFLPFHFSGGGAGRQAERRGTLSTSLPLFVTLSPLGPPDPNPLKDFRR